MIHVWISRSLFGSHVGGRAEGDAQRRKRRRSRGVADGLGDAEVGDHGMVARYENVVRLDVAMDDAVVVRVCQRLGDVAHDPYGVAYGQLALARKLGAQRFALDEGHRVVQQITCLPGRVQGYDVRMLERRSEPDLSPEALDVHGRRHLGGQHLKYHRASERGLCRQKHAAHASTAELALEGVGAAERRLQAVGEFGGQRGHSPGVDLIG